MRTIVFILFFLFFFSCVKKNTPEVTNNYKTKIGDIEFIRDFSNETGYVNAVVFNNQGKLAWTINTYLNRNDYLLKKDSLMNINTYTTIYKNVTNQQLGELVCKSIEEQGCINVSAIYQKESNNYILKINSCK
jgi:hypothetical protein